MRAIVVAILFACALPVSADAAVRGNSQEPAPTPSPAPDPAPAPSPPSSAETSSPDRDGPDTRADSSRRQFCMRWPTDYWCLEGEPVIAAPKPPPHSGFCWRWPTDPFCRDER